MKAFMILTFLFLIACSSAENTPGDPELNPPLAQTGADSKGGVLDEAVKNKDCGLFDQFFDGCRKGK